MAETAIVFMNSRNRAVCLPAAYRFAENEVFIRRDEPDSRLGARRWATWT